MTASHRPDYRPTVRPRAMREEGRRRLTPGYLEDISDTRIELRTPSIGNDTSRFTIKTPSRGRRLRVIRAEAFDRSLSASVELELYFGAAANAGLAGSGAIDLLKVPVGGSDSTRTWARGAGPVGERNEALSGRKRSIAGAGSLEILLEYTEER